MNRVLVAYDDSKLPGAEIRSMVGQRRFGNILIGKQTVANRMRALLVEAIPNATMLELNETELIGRFIVRVSTEQSRIDGRIHVIHLFSDSIAQDSEAACSALASAAYAEKVYIAKQNEKVVFLAFPDIESYLRFLHRAEEAGGTSRASQEEGAGEIRLMREEFLYIGAQEGLVYSLTGKPDTRYFNRLTPEADTITKTSDNKQKIRAEYHFWHLLPDRMKIWFVMPFDLTEDENTASYRMERYYLPNLAVKYVHGAMDETECDAFLTRYFRFLGTRASRPVSRESYLARAKELYLTKTRARLDALKCEPKFEPVAALIQSGTKILDVDRAYERYVSLYERIMKKSDLDFREVIGHGDACLSNILFDHASRTLKFIDPKGAMAEEELWTNPYYDLCKLSHSVIGCYDFFNSGLYELSLDDSLCLSLSIPFDNARYAAALRTHMAQNGYDYDLTRICEAGLFLSMLPLHIDNPHKVLGFFLNALSIMDELEQQ